MKIIIRKVASKIYRRTEFLVKTLFIICIRFITYKSNSTIYVTFDSNLSVDGTGAQLQRMISIYALAKYFGFNYKNSEIKQISVHPLDPFQTDVQYRSYLQEVNEFIEFSDSSISFESEKDFYRYDIKYWSFMLLLIKNMFRPSFKYLALLEPYSVTEFRPQMLNRVRNHILLKNRDADEISHPYAVIHYRQGVGGFAIYPGQNIPRETPLISFEKVLKKITIEFDSNKFRNIVVLTDAPDGLIYYRPPLDQVYLWEGTPGFSNGVLEIHPIDFGALHDVFSTPVKVIRGGNPLEAISIMANSDFLLMSKSSLSYLGGFLNKSGEIFYPRDFWHRPLSKWRAF